MKPDNPYGDIRRAGMVDARNHSSEDWRGPDNEYDPRDDTPARAAVVPAVAPGVAA